MAPIARLRSYEEPALLSYGFRPFFPLGSLYAGIAILAWLPMFYGELQLATAGIHAWTGGAMGVMTLAVMSRASLGHTGRALVAWPMTQVLYGLIVVAALARICAAVHPAWSGGLLHLAGLACAGAFLGFVLTYWNVFTRPRVTS